MSIAYTREGTGPPLLLVHGIGMSGAAWVEVSAALRDRFDVVSVDLPGFGASDPLDVAPTLPALARACEALMREELGCASFAVAGNSLGGGVALDLALRGAVTSATAFSPVGFMGDDWERLHAHATLAIVKALAPLLRCAVPPLPGPLRRAAVITFAWHAERIGPERLRAAFADIVAGAGMRPTRRAAFRWTPAPGSTAPVPLTVAWGEHDLLLPTARQSARARAKLPAARHVALPDVGHLPPWDAPLVAADLVAETAAAR